MTFEYRDNTTCDKLVAQPDTDDDRKPVVFISTTGLNNGVYVPVDHVEELVAGIRDAARTASGQQPEATRVGRCPVMFQGGGRCEKDADHRAGRWPDNPHTPEPAPAVGQPAEAQAVDEAPGDTTAAIEMWARLLNAADVHVNDGDHPTWQQLSTTPGRGQDEYRKAARWLMGRAIVPPEVLRAKILREAADAAASELLQDDSGTPEDEAYNQGVRDAVAAINRRMAEEARS